MEGKTLSQIYIFFDWKDDHKALDNKEAEGQMGTIDETSSTLRLCFS